jgi:dihydrofolate reductase
VSKAKVSASISVDGFGAGPRQSLENPIGVGGEALSQWVFATRTFQCMHHKDWTFQRIDRDGGTTGIDDDFFAQRFLNVGAWIFGRNMFGPVRGPCPDNSWKGPWGDTPPFPGPVFVLTHYPRESIPMQGGTTFHFVTDGIHRALERAKGDLPCLRTARSGRVRGFDARDLWSGASANIVRVVSSSVISDRP